MRPFYKNWGRSVVGVFAVMLVMLNFMSSALAQTSIGGGDEQFVGASCGDGMVAFSDAVKDTAHCHSNAQDCQGGSCHFYLGASFFPLSVVSSMDIAFADSRDQWAISPQATPYRPPIFVL